MNTPSAILLLAFGWLLASPSLADQVSRTGEEVVPSLTTRLLGGVVAAQGDERSQPVQVDRGTSRTPAEIVDRLNDESTRDRGLVELAELGATLPPDRATAWIQLLAAAKAMPDRWIGRAARAVLRSHENEHEAALDEIRALLEEADQELDSLEATTSGDRADSRGDPAEDESLSMAPLLSLAAALADSVDPDEGAELRRRLLEEWPGATEAPEAMLRLARHLASDPEQASEALVILEELLVSRPAHPVAPEARRLRQDLVARGIGT